MASVSSAHLLQRVMWSARQWLRVTLRRIGVMGLASTAVAAVLCVLIIFLITQSQHITQLKEPVAVVKSQVSPDLTSGFTGALGVVSELSDFQKYLLDYGDVPDTLRDLIVLAQTHNLVLSKGEYQSQIDLRGQFLRYQMTLPVRGPAPAVERFILEALAQHKTMALEAVQFKRESRSSTELEAKVQWVVLTRLPQDAGATP